MNKQSTAPKSKGSALILGTAVMALVFSSQVLASENGIKVGSGRLHPYFTLESRYDSAAATVADKDNAGQYKVAGDIILHFMPGIKLDIPSQTVALAFGANLDYVLPSGALEEGTKDADYFGGDGDIDLTINREGQVSASIGDHIIRSDRLLNSPAMTVGAVSLYNDARFKLSLRPSSGSLYIEPEYHLTTENFTKSSGVDLSNGDDAEATLKEQDYLNHTVGLNARWKFLPKTAITLDSAFGVRSYPNAKATSSKDINTIRGAIGLSVLVTSHIFTVLRLGWGQDLTEKSYSSPIGQGEIGYMFSETGSLRAGYLRSFDPSGAPYVTFGTDRVYLEGRIQVLRQKVDLHANGGLDFITFNGFDGQGQTGKDTESKKDRKDTSIGGEIGADYSLTSWATLSGGYAYSRRASNGDNKSYSNLDAFVRNEAYLRAKLMY